MISSRKIIIFYAAFWVVVISVHAWIVNSFGFSVSVSVTDSVLSNFLLMLAGPGLYFHFRYYKPGNRKYLHIFILLAIFSAFYKSIVIWLISNSAESDPVYFAFLENTWPVRFCFVALIMGVLTLDAWLMHNYEEKNQVKERLNENEQMIKDAELQKLRQQLQPHFLFNSLNSINALVNSHPEEARNMIRKLSDFLRMTLKREDEHKVILSDEMKLLELYLDIEKTRFGHRLNTSIQIQTECENLLIPPLLLQPVVENAIKFGLYDTIGEVTIQLDAYCEKNMLVITVKNPYDPETTRANKGNGFGLSAIARRLSLLYSRNDLLETKGEAGIYTTQIKIPQYD